MNPRLFDLDLLRTIVMVADSGSFTAAATRLHSTQSTISQKIRRLEEIAGHRLLDRSHREVKPTDEGETVLGYARRMLALNEELLDVLAGEIDSTIRLGLPDDFVSGPTTRVLSLFSRQYPQIKLEVTSGLSRDLCQSYDQGELDLVIIKQRRYSRAGVACSSETLRWIDGHNAASLFRDPVPIVTFPPRGLYREEMINALEMLGRRWQISFTSSSLSGIQAAVAEGMGLGLLPARAVTDQHVVLDNICGLAPVNSMEVVILHRPTADARIRELSELLEGMLE
ncbi:LysR family transcriptional regulator [Halomonas huangheensis]|uniref:HTH lysR-type domain-containing protein n=1 Tax=Halomonas huangheensis TaxID=1178482 RepID=W1NA06_9GAMM|nr:LysR substrate-binding domain-containing protein [Halomonas huangheensis]ALM53541.1 LysR family transcriptional regulator [Halomonas huangheensis]ERL51770.1 hypothetical protein BJB45_11435 [Halomonas huangheensis]